MTDVEALFDEAAARLLADDPALQRGRMLTATGLKIGGKFFAMVARGELVVKLPAAARRRARGERDGPPLRARQGAPDEGVDRCGAGDEAACVAYMTEARGFVGSWRPPRASTPLGRAANRRRQARQPPHPAQLTFVGANAAV